MLVLQLCKFSDEQVSLPKLNVLGFTPTILLKLAGSMIEPSVSPPKQTVASPSLERKSVHIQY